MKKLICKLIGHDWQVFANYTWGSPPEKWYRCPTCGLEDDLADCDWCNWFKFIHKLVNIKIRWHFKEQELPF